MPPSPPLSLLVCQWTCGCAVRTTHLSRSGALCRASYAVRQDVVRHAATRKLAGFGGDIETERPCLRDGTAYVTSRPRRLACYSLRRVPGYARGSSVVTLESSIPIDVAATVYSYSTARSARRAAVYSERIQTCFAPLKPSAHREPRRGTTAATSCSSHNLLSRTNPLPNDTTRPRPDCSGRSFTLTFYYNDTVR
ncbi:hypothetical protein C8T65DRAFT_106499 [Cerioporus squamosus]|nr:hypothetical protein C8T65DRAFT_106499 [Cerioporus squamosus]